MDEISHPSFERVLEDGAAEGMRAATARRDFRATLTAAVRAQAAGEEPTDATLQRHGGPPPDSTKRLLRHVNLEILPAAQTRTAVDKEFVPPPRSMVVEARTERATGADKFGVRHFQPPPGIAPVSQLGGAPNTIGGIAAVYILAECGDVILPMGEIALQQGWWNPEEWPADRRREVEWELRERADFYDKFVRHPHEVADQLVRRLEKLEALGKWKTGLSGTTIVGGRLCTGFPLHTTERFGAGTEERFLGLDLVALRRIADAGFEAFLEVPQQARGPQREPSCDWRFDISGESLDIAQVERLVHDSAAPWRKVGAEVMHQTAPRGTAAYWLPATASSETNDTTMELHLVFMTDFRGQTDMYVTTVDVDADDGASVARLVGLAAAESGRRRPGSQVETSIEALMLRGFPQRNQRRRAPERRNFSAIAHAAYGVIELARHAA